MNASVCKALTHPVRIQILGLLREGEMAVGEISLRTGRTQPNISQHLNIMRTKGFVSASRRGSNVYYRLTDLKLVRALDLIQDVITANHVGVRTAAKRS